MTPRTSRICVVQEYQMFNSKDKERISLVKTAVRCRNKPTFRPGQNLWRASSLLKNWRTWHLGEYQTAEISAPNWRAHLKYSAGRAVAKRLNILNDQQVCHVSKVDVWQNWQSAWTQLLLCQKLYNTFSSGRSNSVCIFNKILKRQSDILWLATLWFSIYGGAELKSK